MIGLAAIAAGSIAAVAARFDSSDVLGFLLTVQGLRAILFVGLVVFGLGTLFVAARRAGLTSRRSEFAISVLITAVLVGLAFLIQSESQAPKFRTSMFATLLLVALITLGSALLRARSRHPPASRSPGRSARPALAIAGLLLLFLGMAVRMLFMTQAEVDATRAVINFRVSILAFVIFAVVASWMLASTRFGSWTFAVGGNKPAARSVGVPAARTKRSLFMIVSAAAWLVGMLTAFRLNSVQANVGDGEEFQYIIAAVVGRQSADRRLWIGGRRRHRCGHHGDVLSGHPVRGLELRLAVPVPGSDIAPGGACQSVGAEQSRGSAMTAPSLLEVRHVSKYYGNIIALRDITTSVNAGEVTCVLGDNGAGKSSFIKIIAGAHQQSEGQLFVEGDEVLFDSPRDALDRGIATVFQDLAVVPLMSVWRNFFLGSEPTKGFGPFRRIDKPTATRIAKEELAKMGIDIRDVEQPVGTLSGGERQSVAIARAAYFGAKV